MSRVTAMGCVVILLAAGADAAPPRGAPAPQYFLSAEQTHSKFSSAIPPVLRVPSGAVIQAKTQEASARQLSIASTAADLASISFDPIHPLTGPVHVEGAMPGDVLAVTIHSIEIGEWGWCGIFPGFGFLADEFTEPRLRTFALGPDAKAVRLTDRITVPLRPFAGVMGVAPATAEMLSTIPPRANGGNMDNPYLVAGTTVYFPVFVEGGLFSIGDTHAVQGLGEICGTAIEAPMTIVYEIAVVKDGHAMREPQYETDEVYGVTAFAETIDEAAKKASRYMIDYLEAVHGLSREDAYMLCSLAGDLHIAEVVDVPNVLVAMHMSKKVLGID